MGRKRTCELPFCKGVVEGTKNKRRCDNDRNIHLHQVISKNVKRIMRYIENHKEFTAGDVNRDLFKSKLDKNEKGSMYRLFQAMVREHYITEHGKTEGLKLYAFAGEKCDDINEANESHANENTGSSEDAETRQAEERVEEAKETRERSTEPAAPRKSPEEILMGLLREFVYNQHGQWNHDAWMWLINRPDISAYGMAESDIGRLLEEEKARYWLERNS